MISLVKPLLLSASLALSGCAGAAVIAAGEANDADITTKDVTHLRMAFPIMMLVQPEGGAERKLTGKLTGSLDGRTVFTLKSEDGVTCDGKIDSEGRGNLNCSNGLAFPFSKEKSGIRMSGINTASTVRDGTTVDAAFGWGRDANEAALRNALAKKLASNG